MNKQEEMYQIKYIERSSKTLADAIANNRIGLNRCNNYINLVLNEEDELSQTNEIIPINKLKNFIMFVNFPLEENNNKKDVYIINNLRYLDDYLKNISDNKVELYPEFNARLSLGYMDGNFEYMETMISDIDGFLQTDNSIIFFEKTGVENKLQKIVNKLFDNNLEIILSGKKGNEPNFELTKKENYSEFKEKVKQLKLNNK